MFCEKLGSWGMRGKKNFFCHICTHLPIIHLTWESNNPILKSYNSFHPCCYGSSWWRMPWWWHESCMSHAKPYLWKPKKIERLFHLGHRYWTWCQSFINNIMSYFVMSWGGGSFYWGSGTNCHISLSPFFFYKYVSKYVSPLSLAPANFIWLVPHQNLTTKLTQLGSKRIRTHKEWTPKLGSLLNTGCVTLWPCHLH